MPDPLCSKSLRSWIGILGRGEAARPGNAAMKILPRESQPNLQGVLATTVREDDAAGH